MSAIATPANYYGERAVRFISKLTLTKDYAGEKFRLRPWQEQPIRQLFGTLREDGTRQYRKTFWALPRKSGKALSLDTPLPTPRGWTTMGEVQVGDILFDDFGHPCTITYATEVMYDHPCYKVSFSDGTSVVADADHQWMTFTRKPEARWGVYTTEEIADTVIVDKRGYDRNHSLPPAAILDTREALLTIEPYVLGVWLGDGYSRTSRITCGEKDRDEMMALLGAGAGPMRWEREKGKTACMIVMNSGERAGRKTLRQLTMAGRLRQLGVLNNKHIPRSYLRASSRQRLALLQGLMDTDGTVTKSGQCEFTNTNRKLFDGFVELARSLGFKVTTGEGRAKLKGRDCGPNYRARFCSYADYTAAFRLSRKIQRLKCTSSVAPRGVTRKIVSVEPVESVPVRCIQVDSDSHLFLCGEGMVATHNSDIAAAGGLYLLMGAGKSHQQIYIASGDFRQAGLIFASMCDMLRSDPVLERNVVILDGYKKIRFPKGNSTLEVLSSVPKSKHGLSPSCVIIDEFHVVPEELVNVLTTGFGARKDPLTWMITTAGTDVTSLCYNEWEYARNVRDGVIDDPTYQAVIYEADPTDDWADEKTWFKAQPALGDFVSIEFMREEFRKAQNRPRFQSTFKTYYLNLWCNASSNWLNSDKWRENGVMSSDDVQGLLNCESYGGLDLGVTGDMSAAVFLFIKEERTFALCHFWAPEEGKWKEEVHNRLLYARWAEEGFLTFTSGEATDHSVIEEDILEWNEICPIKLLTADRAYATQLLSRLYNLHSIPVRGIPQGPITLAEPMQWLENSIMNGSLVHANHPILNYHVANAKVKTTSTGLMQLERAATTRRVDGVSALVNAIAGYLKTVSSEDQSESVYEKRGVLSV